MAMGRKRLHRRDLPERVYFRRSCYFFVDRAGKWHNLGKVYGDALTAYGRLSHGSAPLSTLGHVFDRYEREIVPTKARKTQEQYRHALGLLRLAFGAMQPDHLTPPDIYAYLDRRPAVAGNREKAVLSAVYSRAIEWGAATANPCRLVRRNTEKPRDRVVTPEEITAVEALASPVQRVAMRLALLTGLRLGDLLALQWADWREDGLHVRTHKTGTRLIFARSPDLVAVLDEARALFDGIRAHILCTRGGHRVTESGWHSMWQRLMTKTVASGIERFHFHDLRSVAASHHAAPQELLGHDDPRTTNRVYRRAPRRVDTVRILDVRPDIGQKGKPKAG